MFYTWSHPPRGVLQKTTLFPGFFSELFLKLTFKSSAAAQLKWFGLVWLRLSGYDPRTLLEIV